MAALISFPWDPMGWLTQRMTLATGTLSNSSLTTSHGFTLLEILIVLLIIGISISFISLNVGPRHQMVREEGRRIAALMNLAEEEAILTADEYALELWVGQYGFVKLIGDSWQELTDDEVFHARTLPAELTLELTIGGEKVPLDIPEKTNQDSSTTTTPPQIYLLSSGEITPFSIDLVDRSSGEFSRITNGPDGLILVEEGAVRDETHRNN
jgi:general secretion pathway protein H